MQGKSFKYIYGPISSWRLGRSLGIDLISQKEKICSFNCIYCQLGTLNVYCKKRSVYVPTDEVIDELKSFPKIQVDYITFSGRGEPTLAKNLGEVICEVKKIRDDRIAVLTNSTLMEEEDVRNGISMADLVIAKLDAFDDKSLDAINKPILGVTFKTILNGINEFRKKFKNRLALQIMFIKENKKDVGKIAGLVKEISSDLVYINTPTRPKTESTLSKDELEDIKKYFSGFNVLSLYDSKPIEVKPVSHKDTLTRRGKINK